MIEQGYSGRKGKGGFYRLNTEGGQKIKEVRDLVTGEYHAQGRRAELTGLEPAKEDIKALVTHPEAGPYAWAVLSDTLRYAASLVPAIADGIAAVDEAMRKGYNWKHGPFEMIDKLGVDWFIGKLEEEGRAVPHTPPNRPRQEPLHHATAANAWRSAPTENTRQSKRPRAI